MKYKSVAGVSVGKPSNTVVFIGDDGSIMDLKLQNRQVYVKKCRRAEEIDGIILTDITRGDTVYSLILGISDDCGKHHKLTKEQKARGELPSVNMEGVHPNMKCVTPDDHPWGIIRSPYAQDEFIIREDIIKWVE